MSVSAVPERIFMVPLEDIQYAHGEWDHWLDEHRLTWDLFLTYLMDLPFNQVNRDGMEADTYGNYRPGRPEHIETDYVVELAHETLSSLLNERYDESTFIWQAAYDTGYPLAYRAMRDVLEMVLSYIPAILATPPPAEALPDAHPTLIYVKRTVGADLAIAVEYNAYSSIGPYPRP